MDPVSDVGQVAWLEALPEFNALNPLSYPSFEPPPISGDPQSNINLDTPTGAAVNWEVIDQAMGATSPDLGPADTFGVRQSSLLEGNDSPLVEARIATDPVLSAFSNEPAATLALWEDRESTLLLQDLFPEATGVTSLTIEGLDGADASWLQLEQRRPDATVAERLVLETLLYDQGGRLLSPEEVASLPLGSTIQADLVVTDTRVDGQGLIGLDLDVNWDPSGFTLNSVALNPRLPLFINQGSLDAANGSLKGLAASGLPAAGVGEVLGDGVRERFASLTFTTGAASGLGPGITIKPSKLVTSKNTPLLLDQVYPLGTDLVAQAVLHGTPTQQQVGSQLYRVSATDEAGRQWTKDVELTVRNRNDGPVAIGSTNITTLEDRPFQLDLSTFFFDEDTAVGDQLSYRVLGEMPPGISLDATKGELSGMPGNEAVGNWTIRVEAKDMSGATAIQTIALAIENVNDDPTVAGDPLPLNLLREFRPFTLNLPTGYFEDGDAGDALTYSLDLSAYPEAADWLSIDATTGEISGVAPGAMGAPFTLQIVATDRAGATARASLSLQVLDQSYNRAPELLNGGLLDQSLLEGQPLSIDLNRVFRDPDVMIGDWLTYTLEAPAWLNLDSRTGLLSGIPGHNDIGNTVVRIQAVDLDGAVAVASFHLDVVNVNQAPQLLGPARSNSLLTTGSTLELDLNTIFQDPDTPFGDLVSYSLKARSTSELGVPDWLTWDPAKGSLKLAPGAADRGLLSLLFTATDRAGLSSSYQLDVGIVSSDGLVEVNQALQSISAKPGQTTTVDLANAFIQLRSGPNLAYSLELLRQNSDGSTTAVDARDQDWITIVDRRSEPVVRDNTITIEPILRLLQTGELITPADISKLKAGSDIQLEISVSDLRAATASAGLIGLDLNLQWQGLTLLDPTASSLKQAISQVLPLFRTVDTSGLSSNSLSIKAASAPALRVGEALGDQPQESFITLNFKLNDPSLGAQVFLKLNEEENGGMGIGLADGSTTSQVNLLDFSSKPLPTLRIRPESSDLGTYVMRLIATDPRGDAVSQLARVDVSTTGNRAPIYVGGGNTLNLIDNNRQSLALKNLFNDPDGDKLAYNLAFQASTAAQEQQLKDAVKVTGRNGSQALSFDLPGLTEELVGTMTITADDGEMAVSQTIRVTVKPRSQAVEIVSIPNLPAVRSSSLVGLADAFGAKRLLLTDKADDTILRVQSDTPTQLKLSGEFIAKAKLSHLQVEELEADWQTSTGANGESKLNISALTQLLGESTKTFDLNWITFRAPQTEASTITLQLSTQTTVKGDADGSRWGVASSSWKTARVRTTGQNEQDPDEITPETERYLSQLKQNNPSTTKELDQEGNNQQVTVLSWKDRETYEKGIHKELTDDTSVVTVKLIDDNPASAQNPGLILSDTKVVRPEDLTQAGQTLELALPPGVTINNRWDPLSLVIKAIEGLTGLEDMNPAQEGTQVVVAIDVSNQGLTSADFNGYMRYISAELLQAANQAGVSLEDLDGNVITTPRWIDFTRRQDSQGNPIGDGAQFISTTTNGKEQLSQIVITLTLLPGITGAADTEQFAALLQGMPVRYALIPEPITMVRGNPIGSGSDSTSANDNSFSIENRPIGGATNSVWAENSGSGNATRIMGAAGPGTNGLGATSKDFESGGGGDMLPKKRSVRESKDHSPEGSEMKADAGLLPRATTKASSDNPLDKLIMHWLEHFGDDAAFVSALLAITVLPQSMEKGLRSTLLDSELGKGIDVLRRNPELKAHWPIELKLANDRTVKVWLRLENGRLALHSAMAAESSPIATVKPGVIQKPAGSLLWQALGKVREPGLIIREINRHLKDLLDHGEMEGEIDWRNWLNEISLNRRDNSDPELWKEVSQLGEEIARARQVDPGLGDALMAIEMLSCHVRLGGKLPWLDSHASVAAASNGIAQQTKP